MNQPLRNEKEAPIIGWEPCSTNPPNEEILVVLSGYHMGQKAAGRWVAFGRRVGEQYFSDETGDELFPPTHWHEVIVPADLD